MSRLLDEWQERKYRFPNPPQADEWIVSQMARLDERLDSVEKALGTLLDEKEKETST